MSFFMVSRRKVAALTMSNSSNSNRALLLSTDNRAMMFCAGSSSPYRVCSIRSSNRVISFCFARPIVRSSKSRTIRRERPGL